MSRTTLLAALAVGAVAAVPSAAAAPVSTAKFWQNSAHTVTCGIEIHAAGHPATRVLCGARGVPRPKGGGNTGDPFVDITGKGSPRLVLISQDSFEGTTPATLSPGTSWSRLHVTCKLAAKTVTCRNASGHGFTIGNGHYHAF